MSFKKDESEPIPNFNDRNYEQELSNIIITTDSISKAIDRLKCSKSQRPDNIHPMLLKECKAALLTPLKYIFEIFYRSVTNQEQVEQVQYSVNEAVTWTNIWEMLFSFKKFKHLHIGSRTDPATHTMNDWT